MATARARHGSYLFQRPGSENFYVKLRSPTGRIEKSLGTSDRREAEIAALPLIRDHKAALLAARPRIVPTFMREYEPGLHTGLNGERIFRLMICRDTAGMRLLTRRGYDWTARFPAIASVR